jgi:hypothetical protein
MSPPIKVGPDAKDAEANPHTNPHPEVGYQQDSRFDDLAARRRRHDAAVRLVGGDPEKKIESGSSSRYHRPSTGLRADGFRDGFDRGTRDALNRIWPLLDADARKAARRIVADLNLQETA